MSTGAYHAILMTFAVLGGMTLVFSIYIWRITSGPDLTGMPDGTMTGAMIAAPALAWFFFIRWLW